jgi:hypothetical protein
VEVRQLVWGLVLQPILQCFLQVAGQVVVYDGGEREITTARKMEDLTSKANDPMRTSGLRAAGAAPAKRGGAVGASKGPHEVGRVAVADPPPDLFHCQVSLDQQTTRL